MSTYNFIISTLAVLAILYSGWMVAKHRMGILAFLGLPLFIGFLWLIAWGAPKFIKEARAQDRKEVRAKEVKEEVKLRDQQLAWAKNSFKIKVGKEPTQERIQTALAEVRQELKTQGIKGSDRQWREFTEANIPVKWDGTQWVRDEAKWSQQWKQ